MTSLCPCAALPFSSPHSPREAAFSLMESLMVLNSRCSLALDLCTHSSPGRPSPPLSPSGSASPLSWVQAPQVPTLPFHQARCLQTPDRHARVLLPDPPVSLREPGGDDLHLCLGYLHPTRYLSYGKELKKGKNLGWENDSLFLSDS